MGQAVTGCHGFSQSAHRIQVGDRAFFAMTWLIPDDFTGKLNSWENDQNLHPPFLADPGLVT